jgi:apolipoprotein N-acyltransferase
MVLKRRTRFLLALGSGLALALAFPNYNLPVFAWFAITLLMLACIGARPWEAALCGFLHGAVCYPLMLPWFYTVMRVYGDLSLWEAGGVLALISFAAALFPLAFTLAVARVARWNITRACLFAPFFWVALEFARTHLPIIGWPWNLTGYAASGNLAFLQLAVWTGIFGLSFFVVAFNALVAWMIVHPTGRARYATVGVTAALAAVALFGPRLVPRDAPRYVANLVSTNFPQSMSYTSDWLDVHAPELDQIENLSVAAARANPGLIVWPEVPAPFSFQDPKFAARAVRIARDSGSDFLLGVDDWKTDAAGRWQTSNSAILLAPSGLRMFTYDKIHLVPFGEYVPLRRWLTFASKLTAGIGDFQPGNQYRAGNLPGGKFSVFICFEAVFPDEVRRFVANGAGVLINISNDGWFVGSAAPPQHLMMARVRAVENRRWLLRDTNKGFTVDVDPYGRYVARIEMNQLGVVTAPYSFRSDKTLYTRWGDWWCWLCVLLSALLFVVTLARKAS